MKATSCFSPVLVHILVFGWAINQLIRCEDVIDQEFATCNSEQLSHSTLVECKGINCLSGLNPQAWPSTRGEILHIQTTRAGDRFLTKSLTNLNLIESENERLLNINTTVYVSTEFDQSKHQNVLGFGATLDTKRLLKARDDDTFEKIFSPILGDLFGTTDSSAQLSLLRLTLEPQQDLAKLLRQLDDQLGKIRPNEDNSKAPIKVVIDLQLFDSQALASYGETMIVDMASTVPGFKSSNLEIWAMAVDLSERVNLDSLGKLCLIIPDSVLVIGYSTSQRPAELPKDTCVKGYLLKSIVSTPYNVLDSLRTHKPLATILRDRHNTKDYGDWQNAHNHALELMNHLKFGSIAPFDAMSCIEVLEESKDYDAPIYSLHKSHVLHFRDPLFYAMGHFSRYVLPNSRPLNIKVFTQPNMFAGHYAAYASPDRNNVIGVVLNDNEHMLPFRLAVDGRIMAHSFLQPKSFNTFVIRLKD